MSGEDAGRWRGGGPPLGYYHSTYIIAVSVCDPTLSGYSTDKRDEAPGKMLFTQRAAEGEAVTCTSTNAATKPMSCLRSQGKQVVMRLRSGALLALVSSPASDPLNPAEAIRDEKNTPAFNRAVQGRYPPGSTFKILMAALAIEKGLPQVYACPGQGYVAGSGTPPIRDSEYYAYQRRGRSGRAGVASGLKDATVHSSNVYFAQLGVASGPKAFNDMMAKAHIHEPPTPFRPAAASLKVRAAICPRSPRRARSHCWRSVRGELWTTPLHVACFTRLSPPTGG